jgi:inosine kinase
LHFPGNRVAKYYFPVTAKATSVAPGENEEETHRWYVVGLDEVLVDVGLRGSRALAGELGLVPGESLPLPPVAMAELLRRVPPRDLWRHYAAGGTVANTLCNFTHLAGEPAVLLGAIGSDIVPGSPAFAYVAQTPKAVDLGWLHPVAGATGLAVTLVTPDGERAFGVAPGVAGDYPPEALPEDVIRGAAVVVTSLYCLADPARPIAAAARRLLATAREADVPVAFGLGTARLVRAQRDRVRELLAEYVTVAAMNLHEAEALTGERDVLRACEALLELVDVALVTEGARGLAISGWTDEDVKRPTREPIEDGSIPAYNRYEYSRLLRRRDCEQPLRVFSRIHPYRGGPDRLSNTSGAGDAALAALLHDIAANAYHRETVPDSTKHAAPKRFLTYSSLSRNAQYGNRVAYEVLRHCSPRLDGPVGPDEG